MVTVALLDKALDALIQAVFAVLVDDFAQQPQLEKWRERLTVRAGQESIQGSNRQGVSGIRQRSL